MEDIVIRMFCSKTDVDYLKICQELFAPRVGRPSANLENARKLFIKIHGMDAALKAKAAYKSTINAETQHETQNKYNSSSGLKKDILTEASLRPKNCTNWPTDYEYVVEPIDAPYKDQATLFWVDKAVRG